MKTAKAPTDGGEVEDRVLHQGELRTHPAYFDRNHKSHKEIVQQVSDLYSQLHGGTK
ncbi:MAG TPA: hypothetical protein VFS98_21435 [Methylomirabilota bacterium]|nr:hypothetical protein [Methylomirabilota bacterium]